MLLFIPIVLATNLQVEQIESESLIIIELDTSASFKLAITNNEEVSDSFKIYSLAGATIQPKENFLINSGVTREIEIEVIPHEKTKKDFRGYHALEYQIKGEDTGYFTDRLGLKIIELKDAIELDVENIRIEDTEAKIRITNLEKREFENIIVVAKSKFFEFSETLTFDDEEQFEFFVPIKKEDTKTLTANEYEIEVVIEFEDIKTKKTETLKYLETGDISVYKKVEGFILRKSTITKTNEGNLISVAEFETKKDVLSRLFTTYSEKPTSSQRNGLLVEYFWEKELLPGETSSITINTNYTMPFVFIFVIILVFLITKFLVRKDISLRKRVSFVKTKGGEFALKVKLRVRANKVVDKIDIVDKIPKIAKLYKNFGAKPDKIDEKARKISWNIKRLNAGEERVFTYIIYSKINVLGRFELPSATAKYEKNGKHEHTFSNKTYFSAETSSTN